MEAVGTNFAVENEKRDKVAVTLVNAPVQSLSEIQTDRKMLDRWTLNIPKITKNKKFPVSSTTQTKSAKEPTINNGIQISDDRFVSSYQIAHCQITATSPPLPSIEFPQLISTPKTKNRKVRRVTRDPDYFVDNLRKYPQDLNDLTSSSELIERVLSASLSKRVSKVRDKHSTYCNKFAEENSTKVIQTHTRSRNETRISDKDGKHDVKSNAAKRTSSMSRKRSSRSLSTFSELSCRYRDLYPGVQRMGRVAEIRYLTDVKKCIKDAIKHVLEEDETVCPNVQERFIMHQKQHHTPCCSKDGNLQCLPNNVDAPMSPSTQDEFKICPVCRSILPCCCHKKKIIRDGVIKCTKFNNQSVNDFSPKTCCQSCRDKRNYKMKVFTYVLKWLQTIPVDANCTCDDKVRRQAVIRELINNLVEFRGMEEKQREAIKQCLEILPMWHPIDQSDRNLFLNKFIENLMNNLKELRNADKNLSEIVSNWINENLQHKMSKNDDKTKNQVVHTLVDRIKSLKLDEIPDRHKSKRLLEKNIKDILKDISLDKISDVTFLDKAANSLAENISVTLPTHSSTVINTSGKDYTTIDLSKQNGQGSNFSSDESKKNKPKSYREFLIDTQISSRNEGSSLEYYNKQTQTTDSIEIINGNKVKFNELQAMKGYVETKLLDALEELPGNINASFKEDLKNDILKIISKNIYLPSSRIKKEAPETYSKNEVGTGTNFNTSGSLSELPVRLEDIQDCVKKQVACFLNHYGIINDQQSEMKHELTNILADQIMRGNDQETVKNTACSILRQLNISESQIGDLCNTILQEVKNKSLIPHDTTPVPDVNSFSYQKKRDFVDATEREIVHFINEITVDNDLFIKQNMLISSKVLAEDIEKLIFNRKHCREDKENMITAKVFNFLKRNLFPTDDTLHMLAKTLAKRLLLIPLQSSTPKTKGDKYARVGRVSPTVSIYREDDEHFNNNDDRHINKDDQYVPGIHENIYLNFISDEVNKWIQRIRSDYKLSHDPHFNRILAKEIAQKVITPIGNPSLNADLVLNHEIKQWLTKIIKLPNQAEVDLQFLAEHLKETLKKKLESYVISKQKPADNYTNLTENYKLTILDWLKKSQLLQNRNTKENIFQENLAADLARDINNIIGGNFSANMTNMDEKMLRAIKARLEQFTTDPELKYNDKYNSELSHQLLNFLKQLSFEKQTKAAMEEINETKDILLRKSAEKPNQLIEELKENVLDWLKSTQIDQTENMQECLALMLASDLNDIICANNNSTNNASNKTALMMKVLQKFIKEISTNAKIKNTGIHNREMALELLNNLTKPFNKETDAYFKESNKIPKLGLISNEIFKWIENIPSNYKLSHDKHQHKILAQEIADKLMKPISISTSRSDSFLVRELMQWLPNIVRHSNPTDLQLLAEDLKKRIQQNISSDVSVPKSIDEPNLYTISNEVLTWIKSIPSDYKLSHDEGHHKMLAKEISKRVQTPKSTRGTTFDLFLKREILQWLPKLLKKLSDADLQIVADDLKETIKQNLSTGVVSIWKFSDDPNHFTENLKDIVKDWLHSVQMYKKSNSQEELLQKTLVSNLARDLNDIIFTSSSTDSAVNKDELLMDAIQTRMKQFTTDPNLKYNEKYNREVALELLKHLKRLPLDRTIETSFEKPNQNSRLDIISDEVHRWMENIPSDYKVCSDRYQQKILAKEIAKRVLAPTSIHNLDSFLDHELLQWLPEVIKYSNETDLQFIANDLKKRIMENLPAKIIPVPESPDSPNKLTNNLKRNILEYIKNTKIYQTRNLQEKLLQEDLVTKLAEDLNEILCDKNYRDSDDSYKELMLNAIKSYIKKFPMEPKLKYNEEYHSKISSEILKYINKLQSKKRSSIIKEENKNTISRWLHNLPLTSTPNYTNTFHKLCFLFSKVLERTSVDVDTEMYLKNEVIDVLQDLPLKEEFRDYQKLQKLADNLIKTLQIDQKNMGVEEISPDLLISKRDQIPVTNTYQNSPGTKVGHNTTNFADMSIATDTLVENDVSPQQKFATGEESVYFGDQHENRKKVEEIKEKLTSGLINILDASNLNSQLREGIIDENILKNDIENLIDALSQDIKYKKFLIPLKQDIANITKEVAEINKKLSAEKDFKKLLDGLINNTLPTSSDFYSKQQTSFENLKEKLIDAFINLNKTSKVNTNTYKEDLKNEVNKFCHDYLKRFPATPVNVDQLREDLYAALEDVSFPKDKSIRSQIDRNNIEDEIKGFLKVLPLQDNKTNYTLKKKFVKSLVNHLRNLKKENNSLAENDTNLKRLEQFVTEKLKEFSFTSGTVPNIREFSKKIIHIFSSQDDKKMDKDVMRQQTEPELKGLQSPTPVDLTQNETNAQRFPTGSKHHVQLDHNDDHEGTVNTGFQTDMTSEFEIAKHPSNTQLHYNRHNDIDHDRTLVFPAPSKLMQQQDNQPSFKGNIRKPHENQSNNHEVIPRVIIKEYHWDSMPSSQLDNLQPECPIKQNPLRRTVPSLPLPQTNIPLAPLEYPKGRTHKNVLHRTYPHWPQHPHYSTTDPSTMSHPVIQEPLSSVPSQTKMVPSNVRYRYGHSGLTRTIDSKHEPFTAFEPKKQRRKFCKDQFTTYSRSHLRDANIVTDDVPYNEVISKCRLLSKNFEGSMPPSFDMEEGSVNENYKTSRRSHSCCNCNKDKSKRNQDRGIATSNLYIPRQRANLAGCEKCGAATCPHPSFLYFK